MFTQNHSMQLKATHTTHATFPSVSKTPDVIFYFSGPTQAGRWSPQEEILPQGRVQPCEVQKAGSKVFGWTGKKKSTCSAGFITRVQPAARAGAHFQASIATSIFLENNTILPTCPSQVPDSYRIVPWDDLSDDSDRLHPGVGHHIPVRGYRLAVHLVRPPGIVPG